MKSRTVSGLSGKRYRYPPMPREGEIQSQILDWLKLKRIFHYRQNVGAMSVGKRFIRFGLKGLPDIICVIRGQYVGLEVKADGKDQSVAQVNFGVSLERAGGKYHVVHSLEEAIKCLS